MRLKLHSFDFGSLITVYAFVPICQAHQFVLSLSKCPKSDRRRCVCIIKSRIHLVHTCFLGRFPSMYSYFVCVSFQRIRATYPKYHNVINYSNDIMQVV